MEVSKQEYDSMMKRASPPSPKAKNMVKAFLCGGFICACGEGLYAAYRALGINEEGVRALVPTTLIAVAALLTALGVFDKIAEYAGAGTIVPITGFANSVVAPALEFQSEGRIMGTGANLFKIAGPVLVFGNAAAVLYGLIYYMIQAVK